jgi:hypothetical protein
MKTLGVRGIESHLRRGESIVHCEVVILGTVPERLISRTADRRVAGYGETMRQYAVALLVVTISAPGAAQTIYPTTPDWVSADTPFSTGAALVDLDRDGWLDLVVANGNDMAVEPLTVYYNLGNGTLPTTPDWQSSDTAYNGHLDVADVNGDGWPDVAVAVLGYASSIDHAAKLYLNNNGTLSSTPDWEAAELANAFGCAFGDVNNDGRPDLAVATGWAYDPQNHYKNWVYLNTGGTLASSASWQSDDLTHLQGVLWVDANDDGWLDLVGVPNSADTMVYTNLGGTLETTASWDTNDSPNQDGLMAVCGDVTGDGHPDLIVTDNTQLSGASGRFRQYDGLAGGYFETTYGWSYFEGYGSAVATATSTSPPVRGGTTPGSSSIRAAACRRHRAGARRRRAWSKRSCSATSTTSASG